MKFDLTNEELNLLSDALEDSLKKVNHNAKVITSRHYRNAMRRLSEKVESWISNGYV